MKWCSTKVVSQAVSSTAISASTSCCAASRRWRKSRAASATAAPYFTAAVSIASRVISIRLPPRSSTVPT